MKNISSDLMKTIELSAPCQPSEQLSTECFGGTRVVVHHDTHKSKVLIAESISEQNGIQTLNLFDGRTLKINSKFIVESEEVKVIKLVTDVTEHRFYGQEITEQVILTEFFYAYANEYVEYTKKNNNVGLRAITGSPCTTRRFISIEKRK